MTQTYSTAAAFKQALEQRLRNTSASGVDMARRRQLVVFHRLLARISEEFGEAVAVKGGLAVELRVERARTTRDIDLMLSGPPAGILERLRLAARRDLQDFMNFTITTDPRHPEIRNEGLRYEGLRFRAECTLAGKIYGRPFGIDVVFGSSIFGETDLMVAEDVLAFANIKPPSLRIYPVETHVAEKLHAYTMPRERPNSRVKDLPDIGLIASSSAILAERLRTAIDETFAFRDTHDVPNALPGPPSTWSTPYAAMARENSLPWTRLDEVFQAAGAFLNPVLAGDLSVEWEPEEWRWFPT